jgi:hypothetical protein
MTIMPKALPSKNLYIILVDIRATFGVSICILGKEK